jgi:hypothetical protein
LKLACCGLLLAVAAQADTVTLTLNGNLSEPTYTYYTYTATDGSTRNEWVAPYQTTLQDSEGTLAVWAICYDINNDTRVGTPFTGHMVDETSTVGLEASYLAHMLQVDELGTPPITLATQGAISLAIWEIMFPSSTNPKHEPIYDDPAAQPLIDQAAAAVASGAWTAEDAKAYPTWMPDDTSIQRFGIIYDTTPEPAGYLLLGSGLVAMAWLWRRRDCRH